MSKVRKLLYILFIVVIILVSNNSRVFAEEVEDFPQNMYQFSVKENATLMSDDFLQKAIKKIGTTFPISRYVQGFKSAGASSHGWCLNENSGNILSKGQKNQRMLLAIIDIAPNILENPTGENAKKAIGYSYQAKGKEAYEQPGSDQNFAAISYLCYLASYYYDGPTNDIILKKADKYKVKNNYAGKVWTQHAWWNGYKKGFATAIKKVMTQIAGNAFESSNSKSYKNGKQIDLVAYNAAMEYADFCDSLNGNNGIAIGSDQKKIDNSNKTDNGIVVGPIELTHLVIDNTAKRKTNAEGGVAEGYVWKGQGKTLKIGEGTKNKIIVTIKLKSDSEVKKYTYDVLSKEKTDGNIEEIKVSTDLNGSDEQNLDKMPVGKEFYLYIKDKNIKYGDIISIEIEDSYQLYRGRMYLFDSCGSGGEDQTVACGDIGVSAGNEKYINNKVKFDIMNDFDLSLRQQISSINGKDIKEERGLTVKEIAKLKSDTTAEYHSKKEAKEVKIGDKIIYTIRVYNEGIIDGYATEIAEYVPEGLKFVENSQINKKYGWDWKDKKTTNINGITYKIYVSDYLKDQKIDAYNSVNDLIYKEIQIELEVDKTAGGEIHNIASIIGQKDIEGNIHDRDSEAYILSGKYRFIQENSTYQEDDDDYDAVYKSIEIGGKVFVDGRQTKENAKEINGVYDSGEILLEGIKVELYNSENKKINETTTDKNGHYKFDKKISSEESYYVVFYYDGIEYKTTEYTHGKADEAIDNDAKENEDRRNYLNEKFREISYEFTKTQEFNDRTITAKTEIFSASKSVSILNNLNLGVYVRNKTDLSLINDVLETNIEVNGKKQTYQYNQIQTAEAKIREDDLTYSQNIYKSDIEKGKDSFRFLVTYRIRVRNESNVATSLKEIVDYYDEKYEYNNVLVQTSNGEKINAEKHDETIYKSKINDQKVNNLNKDSGYKAIYIDLIDDKEIGNGEEVWIDITYELKDAANVIAKELENADKTKSRNYAEIKGYKTAEGVLDTDSTPGNYAINNNATSEDDNGKTPIYTYKETTERTLSGNVWEAISNEIKQGADLYENDKILKYVEQYGIKGIKVELVELCKDGTQRLEQTTTTAENGAYEFKGYIPGDYVVRFTYGTDKNVQGKTTYDYNGKTYNAVINGQNYQSTKANPNINNIKYWYDDNKETQYSDAYDDATKRIEQLNSFTEFGYDEASKLLEQDSNDYQNTEMIAYTGKLELEVEYATPITQYDSTKTPEYNVINVDLGLTPRTEADIQINKTIKHIKITLNNGIVHIDADIEDIANGKVKDAQYLKNSGVNLQLEDEIIQGATLEIEYNINVKNATKKEIIKIFKVENGTTAAVTYYGENIDKHPAYEGKDGENDKVLILNDTSSYVILNKKSEETIEPEIKVLKLFDYSLNLNADIEKQEKEIWKIAENAKHKGRDQEGNEQTFDIPNCLELINGFTLKSGEYKDFGIKSSTVISPSVGTDIDLNYVNNVLISRLSTNTARIKDLTKLDVKSEETIITDPTGQMVIYYIIGGTSIVIFAVGTVLIKKYALKKKEE